MWKTLAGALAVKERLASRGLSTDTTCSLCGQGVETICHVLFNCPNAKETWENSGFPLPRSGFSQTSVFLNLHYLFNCSTKQNISENLRLAFPWLLWKIWKSRNLFIFERTRLEPAVIGLKALEEAEIWLYTNDVVARTETATPDQGISNTGWSKPSSLAVKCNVGVIWSGTDMVCGSAWIVRDCHGKALFYSRRSFSGVSSQMEVELLSLLWAVESMQSLKHNIIIFESSMAFARAVMMNPLMFPPMSQLTVLISTLLTQIPIWSLDHTLDQNNRVAALIARSVTQEHRFTSFVAKGGPAWLRSTLNVEARNS